MGLFDSDGLTRAGYGGGPQLTDWGVIESRLADIGQTSHGGYDGTTAIDAVKRFAATGASPEAVKDFADQIAKKHNR